MSKRAYAYQAHRLLQGDPLTNNEFLLIKLYDYDTRFTLGNYIQWFSKLEWYKPNERTSQLERRIPHTHP